MSLRAISVFFSNTVTLKIRSKSLNSNQFFMSLKFGKIQTAGSQETVQTIKCDADATATANTYRTCTNNSLRPLPL